MAQDSPKIRDPVRLRARILCPRSVREGRDFAKDADQVRFLARTLDDQSPASRRVHPGGPARSKSAATAGAVPDPAARGVNSFLPPERLRAGTFEGIPERRFPVCLGGLPMIVPPRDLFYRFLRRLVHADLLVG